MKQLFTTPRTAAFLFLSILLSACVLGSPDIITRTPTPPNTQTPTPPNTATPSPTATPAPSIPTVGLVGRFANAPAGSITALTFDGIQNAASANSAVWILDVIEIDALDSADPDAAIRMAADHGDSIIVVAGSDLADATRRAANENPNITFIGVDQPEIDAPANWLIVGGMSNRADQEGFLAGALAGYVTKSRVVGAVALSNTLDGKRYTNGFTHGLRYACGDCKLFVIELESAANLEAGAHTATRLQNVQADVMFAVAGEAGESALEAAAAQGMYVVGVGRDYALTLPVGADRALPSILRRPDLSLPIFVNSLVAGNKPASPFPFSLENGNITLSPNYSADVSPAVIRLMDDLIPLLASGALDTGVDPATGEVK